MADAILCEILDINELRANHKRKVEEKLYKQQKSYYLKGTCEGTLDDLLNLQEEEDRICELEEDFLRRTEGMDMPEYISTRMYSETMDIPLWKVYRDLKNKRILAEKVKGRWRIFTNIESISEAV